MFHSRKILDLFHWPIWACHVQIWHVCTYIGSSLNQPKLNNFILPFICILCEHELKISDCQNLQIFKQFIIIWCWQEVRRILYSLRVPSWWNYLILLSIHFCFTTTSWQLLKIINSGNNYFLSSSILITHFCHTLILLCKMNYVSCDSQVKFVHDRT
jgi:hypothetical protein